jgi:enoyl-CoA hydratase/carnithine racemase
MAAVETLLKHDVFIISLNKPDVRNAFDPQMIEGLTEAFRQADISDCRVVYLKGEGKSFCAGADLKWMRSMKDFSLEENLEDSKKTLQHVLHGQKVLCTHCGSSAGARDGWGHRAAVDRRHCCFSKDDQICF